MCFFPFHARLFPKALSCLLIGWLMLAAVRRSDAGIVLDAYASVKTEGNGIATGDTEYRYGETKFEAGVSFSGGTPSAIFPATLTTTSYNNGNYTSNSTNVSSTPTAVSVGEPAALQANSSLAANRQSSILALAQAQVTTEFGAFHALTARGGSGCRRNSRRQWLCARRMGRRDQDYVAHII